MKHIEIANVSTSVGEVKLITMRSKHLEVVLSSYGAGIYQFRYNGKDIAVHPESLEDYLISKAYYGKTVGRHSGRLFGPSYDIDGKTYEVHCDPNEPSQCHGGPKGLSFQHFILSGYERMGDATRVTFSTFIKAFSDGFPGNLKLDVSYEITKDEALRIKFVGHASEPTLCHLTNHIYFNLGQNMQDITDHDLYIKSSKHLNIDEKYRIQSIQNSVDTPFDFRVPTRIKDRIKQVKQPDIYGFDHNFLLDEHDLSEPVLTLSNQQTKIAVDVLTNYPSVVIYTHNHPASAKLAHIDNDGIHRAIAVECQYPPDSIHHGGLESGILRPGVVERKFITIKPYIKK